MRLLTWNIRNGGGDRLPAIIEVVRAVRPDIWAVQELRGFSSYAQSLTAAVGMRAHAARSLFGQPVAVLTSPPVRVLRRSTLLRGMHHAAAAVVVDTPSGPLTVVSTHLNPYSPSRRRREARRLVARYAGDMTVVAGDLNSLDTFTDHGPSLDGQREEYRRRHVTGQGVADTRALAAFENAHFTDLWRNIGSGESHTVPTSGLAGAEFGTMRLDYVLTGPGVTARARSIEVLRGGALEHASDHYPVLAEFDL
ncbi:endonuclease/exonuclease/phosphatase family protein [Actinoplanes sp. NBRC 101535]|uniref:endonuclease/exonuclease/phosphatase family protein n=1 Tax=Actinoplanes sp. NBRC 101535 TaxID=3032196 RepID=UPI0024A347FC|nr:endonuclease/exonuclease/phosphatase family protein [Actinoplanes sp. NBRC 101535]GLY05694.1 hypothetical protein Acsp01_60730 [Actinoplanes sp. NBRC 101535]